MGGTLTAWRAATLRALRRIGAAIVLLLLAAGLALWWASRWTPDRALYPTQGVTIDAGNGDVHWGSIKAAGAEFAYIMATDGAGGIDPKFARNMAEAREVGVQAGAIHRYSLCQLRSDEHTSELQSLMRISYAVFCLNKKNN